jgi:putative membrane protein
VQNGTKKNEVDSPIHHLGSQKIAMPNQQDVLFVQEAARSNLAEITEGNLAIQRAPEVSIRDFGSRMVTDHTAQTAMLTSAATNAGIPVPTDLDAAHQAEANALSQLSGTTFDRAYLADQVTGHQATLAILQQEVAMGQDPGLVQVAQTAIPVVQDHLNMAEKLTAAEPKTLAGVTVQDALLGLDRQTLRSDLVNFSVAQSNNPLWWSASANTSFTSPYDTLAFSGGAGQFAAMHHQS